jgi:hypothetical protein
MEFSQGKNELGAAASNKADYLLKDTYVSLTQLNRPICNKLSLCPP